MVYEPSVSTGLSSVFRGVRGRGSSVCLDGFSLPDFPPKLWCLEFWQNFREHCCNNEVFKLGLFPEKKDSGTMQELINCVEFVF